MSTAAAAAVAAAAAAAAEEQLSKAGKVERVCQNALCKVDILKSQLPNRFSMWIVLVSNSLCCQTPPPPPPDDGADV